MAQTKVQLFETVATIIFLYLILNTLDVFTDLQLIIKLFSASGVTECSFNHTLYYRYNEINYTCETVGAKIFCSNNSAGTLEHDVCCNNANGDCDCVDLRSQYMSCIKDPEDFCKESSHSSYPEVCTTGYYSEFGIMLLGKLYRNRNT